MRSDRKEKNGKKQECEEEGLSAKGLDPQGNNFLSLQVCFYRRSHFHLHLHDSE